MDMNSVWENAYTLHKNLEEKVLKRKGFEEFGDKDKVITHVTHSVGLGIRGNELDSFFAALTTCKELNCSKVIVVTYGEHRVSNEHKKYSLIWQNNRGAKVGLVDAKQIGGEDLSTLSTPLGETPFYPYILQSRRKEIIETPYNGVKLYDLTKIAVNKITNQIDIDGINVEVISFKEYLSKYEKLIRERIDDLVSKVGEEIKGLFLTPEERLKAVSVILTLDQEGLPFGNMHGYQAILPLVLGREGEAIAEIISYRGGYLQDGPSEKDAKILENVGANYKRYLALSREKWAYTQMITVTDIGIYDKSFMLERQWKDLGFTMLPLLCDRVGEELTKRNLLSNSYKANMLWLMEEVYKRQSKELENGNLPKPYSIGDISSWGKKYKKVANQILVRP